MLDEDQLGFFARNGFIHLARVIPDQVCEELTRHTWTRLPGEWDPDSPEGWKGTVTDSCHTGDLRLRRGLLQFQKGDLIDNETISAAFGAGSGPESVAKALIGSPLAKMRIRGLYCIVPLPDAISYRAPVRPHIESHAAQLIFLFYLRDVQLGGGALNVWPGSHREIYPAMGSKLEHTTTEEYTDIFKNWARKRPIEVPGKAGDAVIIHHRLLHAPSLNRSDSMRYAFLCDYQRKDFRKLATEQPSNEIWEDWPAIREIPEILTSAPSDYLLEDQEGLIEDTPIHSAEYQLSVAHSRESSETSIRKADASALARSRHSGDIWLAISDDPSTLYDWQLHPKGSDLSFLQITVNGEALKSRCKFDYFQILSLREGLNKIIITNSGRHLYVRIIEVALPFDESKILAIFESAGGSVNIDAYKDIHGGSANLNISISGSPEDGGEKVKHYLHACKDILQKKFRGLI